MKLDITKIYLAAPFFSPKQEVLVDKIVALLKDIDYDVYSPKDEFRYKKDDPLEKAKKVFDSNITAMNEATIMLVIVDDYDPGTLFEMGYFHAQDKPIICYSNVKGRGLNLMLSQSAIGFADNLHELADILVKIKSENYEITTYKGRNI